MSGLLAQCRSEVMKAIGGYFELADRERANNFPHKDGILLNTGRNALEYILRSIDGVSRVYLPYYTCEAVLEPIRKLKIPYHFYHISSCFEVADRIDLEDGEYIIVNNYYGIKDSYIRSLCSKYKDRIIVDCAQAFFFPIVSGIKAFYSPRKYVGVADGGIAYIGKNNNADIYDYDEEPTELHSTHLFIRKEQGAEAGFGSYQYDEEALDNQPIRKMSAITKDLLFHIDYEKVKTKRIENWNVLSSFLSDTNQLEVNPTIDFECPMVYPYIIENGSEIRQKLIKEKVFVARYWPNVTPCVNFDFEADLAKRIVAIPLDQRYVEEDMERIVYIIND
mgnify:CR=1 FL=1